MAGLELEGKVAGPELELSTEEISAGQYVTTSIINVTCEMDWTATPSHDWINVGSGNGSGNGTIVVIIYANETGATRNGTITVSNTINQKIVSVTQSGN